MAERRAGIYVRISDDRAGAGLGVARQEADSRTLCDQLGWTLHDVYTDNDITAFKGKRRPAYEQLLADITSGQVDAVIAWHPDRLHRSPLELEHFINIIETAKASVATVTAGTYDLATPSGRMVARTLGNAARYESEHKAERIRRKHMELAEAGRRHGGGSRQFGFLDDRTTIHADEAALIRQAARRVLAGETVRSICADWTANGIPTVNGGAWSQTSLKRTLTAASIAGLREHLGVTRPGTWPAILDEATWRRLRVVLLDPDRRRNLAARRYLLTGFLACGQCHARMVARPRDDKRRAYVCATGPGFTGCGKSGALAEPLEDAVARVLFAGVDSARVAAAVARQTDSGDDILLAELAADEASLEQLAHDRYVARIISPGQFVAASQALESKVAATKRRLRRKTSNRIAEQWVSNGGPLAETWPAQNVDWKRAVLGAFVDTVTLGPAVRGRNWFDQDRLLEERGGGILWRY